VPDVGGEGCYLYCLDPVEDAADLEGHSMTRRLVTAMNLCPFIVRCVR